jgi:hypothetical protein
LTKPLLDADEVDPECKSDSADAVQRAGIAITVPSLWRRQESRELKESFGCQLRKMSESFRMIRSRSFSGRLTEETLLVQVLSPEYIGIVTWYTMNLTLCVYFFGMVGSQINNIDFCNRVVYIGSGVPALLSILVGTVIGWMGWGFATFATAFSCMLMFVLIALQDLYSGYIALFVFTVQRSFTFAVFFSYIPATFGSANYGRLIGLATLISGAVGFINGPVSAMSGLQPSSQAVCNQGLACTSWSDCALPNFVIAASTLPLILYSVWLSKRSKALAKCTADSKPVCSSP